MAKNKTNTAPSTTARGQRAPKGVLRRLLRTLFEFYPVLLPVTHGVHPYQRHRQFRSSCVHAEYYCRCR